MLEAKEGEGMKNLFLLFIIVVLSGCSNGFSKYYQGENLIENKNEASNYEMTEDVNLLHCQIPH